MLSRKLSLSAVTVTSFRAWIMPTWIRWVATMIEPQLTDRCFQLHRNLPRVPADPVRAIRQTRRALLAIPPEPGMHALAADSIPFGDLGHRNTGCYLKNSPVSLLDHT